MVIKPQFQTWLSVSSVLPMLLLASLCASIFISLKWKWWLYLIKLNCVVEDIPGEGNGNPLQYSCLVNPMDRGAWWATVHRVTNSQIWLSDWTKTSGGNTGRPHFISFHFTALHRYGICYKLKVCGNAALSDNCCSVTQSCLTLCDPMDCSTPGFPVLHYLPEFAQIHVQWVDDAIKIFTVRSHLF